MLIPLNDMLCRYVTLMGRLVYEFGTTAPWETEVVAMLSEDRNSIFGGSSDGGGIGDKVVGSSLAQVTDTDARDLFQMLAVLPEDVPAPMPVLELVWSAKRSVAPPLGRVGMMKLRRWCFQVGTSLGLVVIMLVLFWYWSGTSWCYFWC